MQFSQVLSQYCQYKIINYYQTYFLQFLFSYIILQFSTEKTQISYQQFFSFKIVKINVSKSYQLFWIKTIFIINMSGKDVFVGNNLNGYTFLSIIGKGHFSKVYLATNSKEQKFAIKIVNKEIEHFEKIQQLLISQVRILRAIKNENVIKVHEAFRTKKYVFLVLQYCNGGDLKELLRQKKRFPEAEAITYMKHILNGFKGLHALGVIHRDIKLDNILLHNSICKIADFGFSKIEQETQGLNKTNCGTPFYMAPQLLDYRSYDNRVDIWALGVLYYYMLYGYPPFNGVNVETIKQLIMQKNINFKKVSISDDSKDFIISCLTINPQQRITWDQIYSHSLFNDTPGAIYGELKSQIKIKPQEKKQQMQMVLKIQEQNEQMKESSNSFPVPSVSQDIRHSENVEQLRVKIVQSLQKEKDLHSIQKQYIKVRNQIMFPMINLDLKIRRVFKIKANHAVIIFLLYKASYLKLKAFSNALQRKKNCLNIQKLWKQYLHSEMYSNLKTKINEDKQIVKHQMLIYKDQLGFCNQQLRDQLDIEKTEKKDFKKYLQNQLIKYWITIAKKLVQYNGRQWQDMIRLLISLQYYIKCQHPYVQNFDMIISQLDYDDAAQKIKTKLVQYRLDPDKVPK